MVSALRDMAPDKPVEILQAVAARGVNERCRLWLFFKKVSLELIQYDLCSRKATSEYERRAGGTNSRMIMKGGIN